MAQQGNDAPLAPPADSHLEWFARADSPDFAGNFPDLVDAFALHPSRFFVVFYTGQHRNSSEHDRSLTCLRLRLSHNALHNRQCTF